MRNKIVGTLLLLALMCVGFRWIAYPKDLALKPEALTVAAPAIPALAAPAVSQATSSALGSPPPPPFPTRRLASIPRAVSPGLSAAEFLGKYGQELKLAYGRDGRLDSAKGRLGIGSVAGSADFSSQNPQALILRAREILDAAGPLIGAQDRAPIGNPVARADGLLAEVAFRESIGGLPLYPRGGLVVDLGSRGELIGFYPDYVRDIQLTGRAMLAESDARKIADDAVSAVSASGKPVGGAQVAWQSGTTPAGAPQARVAYQYQVRGFEVVVDAENGSLLARRNRRNY